MRKDICYNFLCENYVRDSELGNCEMNEPSVCEKRKIYNRILKDIRTSDDEFSGYQERLGYRFLVQRNKYHNQGKR